MKKFFSESYTEPEKKYVKKKDDKNELDFLKYYCL